MSPHGINSLVGDLVEMAKATERLPQLEQELNAAKVHETRLQDHIHQLSADLEQSRNYAASLEQKVRSLEVERDDASFRVLEAEDLTHNTLSRLRAIQTALGGTVDALNPPKPEPVKEPEPVALTEDQRVPDPLPVSEITDVTAQSGVGSQEAASSLGEGSTSGQSESSPTVSTGQVGEAANSQAAPNTDAGSTTTETSSVDKGPYFDKLYHDMPTYISYQDWIAGGGTDADYYWRPTPPIASRSY